MTTLNYICFHTLLAILMVIPHSAHAEGEVAVEIKKETKILFLGDSLTAGFGVDQEEAFPTLIDQMLRQRGFSSITVINGGISGSTTASAVSRLKWYGRMKPDILFLALGANDGLRGLSLEAMEQNLGKAIDIALAAGMEVILAGMEIPPNYGERYTRDFRNCFRSLAEKKGVTLMPYLLKDVGGFADLNQPDGLHPNGEGYKIVARNVLPYILEKL